MVRMYVERSKAKTFLTIPWPGENVGNPDYGINRFCQMRTLIHNHLRKPSVWFPSTTDSKDNVVKTKICHLSLRFVGFMFLFLPALMIICEDSFSICFLPVQKMQVFPKKKISQFTINIFLEHTQKTEVGVRHLHTIVDFGDECPLFQSMLL